MSLDSSSALINSNVDFQQFQRDSENELQKDNSKSDQNDEQDQKIQNETKNIPKNFGKKIMQNYLKKILPQKNLFLKVTKKKTITVRISKLCLKMQKLERFVQNIFQVLIQFKMCFSQEKQEKKRLCQNILRNYFQQHMIQIHYLFSNIRKIEVVFNTFYIQNSDLLTQILERIIFDIKYMQQKLETIKGWDIDTSFESQGILKPKNNSIIAEEPCQMKTLSSERKPSPKKINKTPLTRTPLNSVHFEQGSVSSSSQGKLYVKQQYKQPLVRPQVLTVSKLKLRLNALPQQCTIPQKAYSSAQLNTILQLKRKNLYLQSILKKVIINLCNTLRLIIMKVRREIINHNMIN
ncbi:unnamed protein product [Paramecium sonneborni]|uniref:Uncharacterized protein n=1 Tax=Paramecium sonneborni TaxID=65129 RepID=A0A8S1QG14_9CILI|nr:unnamed protein product [Paramecium sonneborni]